MNIDTNANIHAGILLSVPAIGLHYRDTTSYDGARRPVLEYFGALTLMQEDMMGLRDIELAAVQMHILHHAAQQPIYGQWMMEELARHGYRLSYGTLYPTLHRMLEGGLLERKEIREGSQVRKYYTATAAGRETLGRARRLISELYREVVEEATGEG